MRKQLQTRVTVVLLALLTVAAAGLATLNLLQDTRFQAPTDGVWWTEAHGGLRAERVPPNSAGERAGVKPGDLLTAADGHPTPRVGSLVRQWFQTGVYRRITYSLVRSGAFGSDVRLDATVILVTATRNFASLRLVALVYLLIGLYVLFRRWTAPHATHFYLFCLLSFVLYAFHYTGKLNGLDWTVYWANIVAGALQPALFLHFALVFPLALGDERPSHRPHIRTLVALTYLPAALVVALQAIAFSRWSATENLSHRLDQLATGYLALFYVLAAAVFIFHYRRTVNPLRRQQLKWLTRGTLLSVIPFTLLNVIPFLADWSVPTFVTSIAGLSLVFLPLTFSWAIIRYRLMDVDLIFKRGVTYTLATAALVGLYFGVVALAAEVVNRRLPAFGAWGMIAAIIITGQLFEPLKRTIQERVDRVFDRKRYDYRQTLVEFGRSLSSETDLNALMDAIVDRLPRTLLLDRVVIFLAGPRGSYTLAASHGRASFQPRDSARSEQPGSLATLAPADLDLSFLHFDQPFAPTHIFLENPANTLHLPEPQRRSAAALDLNYYLPCRAGERTIAVIGLGRTTAGDFLSSEEVELLESLASYIGIAIQNARLYASLADKAAEYERLKDFNESIVESVNVGIFTIDLDERIESWNVQMEVMFASPRAEVLGKPLDSLFPPDFVEDFHRTRDLPGVHNLYKFRLELGGGEVRIANIAIAPLVARDLRVVGRIILVDDITGRTQLEAQLTQAEKLSSIGLLAAGVAHEVNTPLAVISSYTQMLAKQLRAQGADDGRLSGLLDKITKQTFRASEIVNSLLNFSRTGGTEFRDVDLNKIIEESLVLLEHQFKTAQVTVACTLDPALPAVCGNAGKLQQVFLNLFLNAKDAMAGGGTLRICTESHGRAEVTVADTGGGIAPEHVQRIYDPFFTTKSAPVEGGRRGTGLGLAVTYGILQEHAGTIEVQSEVGSGTTFRLAFPLVRKPVHA